ncbi:hypothetical protein PG985_003730 [Apiospora marii]|uniref:uncharacterized protein n=1 Tax=Apiospora marii TaxID=335849 RepID=UPI0031328635
MTSALTIRCANDPKDYSLWDSHKETFRRLFLTEGSSLADVKAKMEADFEFPETNVKTYEVVLREHFKFRKKLEAGQWLLVGQILDRQRQLGLDCVVYLSGAPLDKRLVLKNIRRERRDVTRGRLKPSTRNELPSYLEITPQECVEPAPASEEPPFPTSTPGTALSLTLFAEATASNSAALIPFSNLLLSQSQAFGDTFSMNEVTLENIVQTPIARVYEELRKIVPSKQLTQLLRRHLEGNILSVDDKFMLAGVLHGLVYMIRHHRSPISNQPPLPQNFGMNSSFAVLERACLRLSHPDILSPSEEISIRSPVLRWIADVADPLLLQHFFGLQQPAVAALWKNLYSIHRNRKASRILMEVALRLHRGDWLRRGSKNDLRMAIFRGDEDTAVLIMDLWQTGIGHRSPLSFSKVLFRPGLWLDHLSNNELIASLKIVLRLSLQPEISDWIPPSLKLLPASWTSLCGPSSITSDDLEDLQKHFDPEGPILCSTWMNNLISIWAYVVAAKSGLEALQLCMSALDDHTSQDQDRLQQLALMEVAGQGDSKATTLFLDVGVDHEANLLPKQSRQPMDPLSRAAGKCNTYLLPVLLDYGVYELHHIVEAIVASTRMWSLEILSFRDMKMKETIKETTTNILLHTNVKAVWEGLSDLGATDAQNRVLHHCQQQINMRVDPLDDPCALLSTIFPHDTLRKAIKHGFGLNAIESLFTTTMIIRSDFDENGDPMLINALLSASKDRNQIVHWLLMKGADPRVKGLSLTSLEAALWNTRCRYGELYQRSIGPATGLLSKDEDRRTALELFKTLFELGAPVIRDSANQKPCSRPLLELLIGHNADLLLVQQVVAAGAKINDQREEHVITPLNTAIWTKQVGVAKWLIEQGADVNAITSNSLCEMGNLSIAINWNSASIQLLIEKGADVDPPESPGRQDFYYPMGHAMFNGQLDVVIKLLTHGFKLNQPRGQVDPTFAVDDAAWHGQLDILSIFIESGGKSIYPGASGFDRAFYDAYICDHCGILMYLEQLTGWATSAVISSLKGKRKELGRWPWQPSPK